MVKLIPTVKKGTLRKALEVTSGVFAIGIGSKVAGGFGSIAGGYLGSKLQGDEKSFEARFIRFLGVVDGLDQFAEAIFGGRGVTG